MTASGELRILGRALALGVAVACANARAGTHCTDTVFVDGFDGAVRGVAGATIALASDGWNLFTFDVSAPESPTIIGPAQGSAFLLAFVDGNANRAFGLAQDWAVSPDLLATIRLDDAAITPIGHASPHDGDWLGFKQSPATGELYAVAGCPSSSTLYTIDRTTAAPHPVGNLIGTGCATAIAIDGHGRMYAIGSGELLEIDVDTLVASPIGPLGFDAGMGDMDFVVATGTLYLAARNNTAGRAELRSIDPLTGASTFVGVIPGDYITGFAIENGVVCSP